VTVSVLGAVFLTMAMSMTMILFQRVAVGAATVTVSMTMTMTIAMSFVSVAGVMAGVRGVLLELDVSALVAAVSMSVVLNMVVIEELFAVDLGLESIVLIRRIVDSSLVTIGIDQLIVSGNLVPMS